MEKAKYLFQRIVKMNYKNFFKVINNIHKKTGKSRIYLFFDIIYCGLKYQAGFFDYELFEMYNLNRKQRKTVLTRGINNHFIKTYNDKRFTHFFLNKDEFNKKFDKFIKREWLIINENNEDEFNEFIKDKDEIIVKPTNGTHGDKIRKIKPNSNTFKELLENKTYLVEEVIKQIPEMNKLNPSSVNTIRTITFNENGKTTIITAYLRIGNNKVIDNFNGGGMVVPINVKTKKIEYPALDKKGNLYYEHPTTKTPIVGFEIPMFDEIEKLVTEAGKVIPEVKFIGWDVALSEKGPCLVEGNDFPGHDIYQLPPHRKDGIGVLPEFEKVLKK
ncbi:MAG: sugar-transfer associated ATP-grasp domain-containing protein [Candidatus Faecisoma sp.]|nr:sugar-transfer associated ATP-grasp domain-containing protein [Candidatus Faecisoma sp.]